MPQTVAFQNLTLCRSCRSTNRIPAKHLADTGRCGSCKAPLGPADEPIEADSGNLLPIIQDARVPILVDFWAPWCGPCLAAEPEVKLLSKIGEFRGEASFESWLYRLVVNGCLDHRRAGRRWSPLLDGWLGALRASGESVLQQLLRSEVQENVQQVVAKLPAELRIVVILRYTEQLSYDEIAEILGCPQGTVASRLNRAHKLLERRLAGLRNNLGGNRV